MVESRTLKMRFHVEKGEVNMQTNVNFSPEGPIRKEGYGICVLLTNTSVLSKNAKNVN